jgi:hypothetical protein
MAFCWAFFFFSHCAQSCALCFALDDGAAAARTLREFFVPNALEILLLLELRFHVLVPLQ